MLCSPNPPSADACEQRGLWDPFEKTHTDENRKEPRAWMLGNDVDVHWLRPIIQKVEQQLSKELRAGLN